MEGDYHVAEHRGIIPRTVEILFDDIAKLETQEWKFEIECSFQEIYCDEIRDLLEPANSMKQLNKASSYEPTVVKVTEATEVYL